MSTNDESNPPGGTGAGARALDALIDAGWNADAVDPSLRPRAQQILALMRGVDAPSQPVADDARSALVDLTMVRVLRAGRRIGADEQPPDLRLAPMDEEAADAWVRSSYRVDRIPSDLRERVRRHAALADLLGAGLTDTGQPRDLIDRTMRAVASARPAPSDIIPISRARFRVADLATVAAAVLILGAVLWPMVSAFRGSAMRTACEANMAMLATGMSSYAESSKDSLPLATAAFGDSRWWDVGRPTSNSANLFKLFRDGYVSGDALACPGNPHACKPGISLPPTAPDWQNLEQVSYSMQILRGPDRPNWGSGERRPIMADRSPIVLASLQGRPVWAEASSPNHGGYGQFILMSDGSSEWHTSPVLENGDNIWWPRRIEDVFRVAKGEASPDILKGTEVPGKNDAFFGP